MGDIAFVEETLKRFTDAKGILGSMIITSDGIPIRSTLDNALTIQYGALVSHFVTKSRAAVKAVSSWHQAKGAPEDELQFLRIRSNKHEVLIAPDFDKGHEYTLVVLQSASMP